MSTYTNIKTCSLCYCPVPNLTIRRVEFEKVTYIVCAYCMPALKEKLSSRVDYRVHETPYIHVARTEHGNLSMRALSIND